MVRGTRGIKRRYEPPYLVWRLQQCSGQKFYHIAHVWDGKEHHIYWEGELFSKGTDGNGQLKTKGKCCLGATDTRFNYGGEIKGVRVFNSALTAGEIKTVYNAGKAPPVVAPAPTSVPYAHTLTGRTIVWSDNFEGTTIKYNH